jgi:hypothetical protein
VYNYRANIGHAENKKRRKRREEKERKDGHGDDDGDIVPVNESKI